VRVLVTVNDALGHLFPLVPTLVALTEAGADVVVACPGSAVDAVADRVAVCPIEPDQVEVPAFPVGGERQQRFMFAVTRRWPSVARGWAAPLLAEAESWRPDVVVVEPTEHAGRLVASALGLPWVEHGWGFSLPAVADAEAISSLDDLYGAIGASACPPAARVDLGPQRLQAADAPALRRFRYRPWSPPAATLPAPGGRRRILVTLGTFPNPDAPARLAATAQAAAATGAETIVILGNRELGEQTWPDGVLIAPWVDTAQEVARCDLVVHHGGAGTAYACVVAGVPAVCLPQLGDQFRNADLLAKAGVCLVSAPEDASESRVRVLIEQALTDDRPAAATRSLRDQNAQLPDVDTLTRLILDAAA
jgi:L-demethylnoviosyl transferase